MTQSLFTENIETHAARVGLNTRQTKVYRSLAAKHRTGQPIGADRNTSAYMAAMPLAEIEKLLCVRWDAEAKTYRPIRGQAPRETRQLAQAGTLFQPPAEHRLGAAPAHVTFGWQPDGQLDRRYSKALSKACDLVAEGRGYTVAADYLNAAKVPTASGGKWNSSLFRDWAQNPWLAGYVRNFADGSRRKRGPWEIRPGTHAPLVPLAVWLDLNTKFLCSRQDIRFIEFRSSADRDGHVAWERTGEGQ